MYELLIKQFKLTRGYFIKNVETISGDTASVQPAGFNNTIHWQIGHVLTVTEQFMLGFPHKTNHLPTNYIELFGNGTKPADWEGEIPPIEELIPQLKEQLDRLQKIPMEQFNVKLDKPFMGLETFGELAGLTLMHEANHLGQIQAMKRLIEQAKVLK
ncbi:DinB family protein [Heyndrickxia sp. NPDC080065]|uniref:DinB family protein n=1 Tax=Heyndrickxia sp. NPDC080065 TaxID=3390568 RepID=UPI003D0956D1